MPAVSQAEGEPPDTSLPSGTSVLAAECAHLTQSREFLQLMREDVLSLKALGGDPISAEYLKAELYRRAEALRDLPDTPLFFGRLDYAADAEPDEDPDEERPRGESFHVGRRHVHDPSGHPVVIDWRAPVSRPFYRASRSQRMGLALRRRFGFSGGELTAFEDERFLAGPPEHPGLGGPGRAEPVSRLLIEEIERPRSGPMRDIVATIQPDQDDIVRADVGQTVCVQGAPGTGNPVPGVAYYESVKLVDLYLRLSDLRNEEALDGREAKLRTKATDLGLTVHRVVIENDMVQGAGDGKLRPASAFKRRKVLVPGSDVPVLRVIRPGFRSVLEDITSGRAQAVLAEDLDRVCRDPRDLEDLIDACALRGASALSLSGSLRLTNGGTSDEISMARMMVVMAAKASADTARRVADGRERWAGKSYGGGPRPYCYVIAPDTIKYHRTLIVVPEEAAIASQAATDILDHDVSLASIAAELRDRGEPTVTGAPWSAETLKDILTKPAIAGIAVHTSWEEVHDEATGEVTRRKVVTQHAAPWDAVLERDVWERLVAKLTDPARGAHCQSPAPRWLLSLIGLCGVCNDGTVVKSFGGARKGPAYRCMAGNHLRRNAAGADEYVSQAMIRRLSKPDINDGDTLKPPPRPEVDAPKLRTESRKLTANKTRLMEMAAVGDLDDEDLKVGLRKIRERLAQINAQLADSDKPDPLVEFRDHPAGAVWQSLSLARKREIVKLLARVTFLPARRGGRGFDEDSVDVEFLT